MNKNIAKTLGVTTAAATVFALGGLSFVGMLGVAPILPLCGVAFFLAAFVEAHVYQENLIQAFQHMAFNNARYLKRAIISRYLKQLLDKAIENNQLENQAFLKIYKEHLDDLEEAHEEHEKLTKWKIIKEAIKHKKFNIKKFYKRRWLPLEERQRIVAIKQQQAESNLAFMEDFLLGTIESPQYPNQGLSTYLEDAASHLLYMMDLKTKTALQNELVKRPRWLRVSYIFSIAAGLSTGFAALSAYQLGVLSLGVASVIPGGVFIALSACAAMGYTLLMYRTIEQILADDTVFKYWTKFKESLKGKTIIQRVSIVAGAVIIVGVAIAATIATAGTWWYASELGLASLGKLNHLAVNLISQITTVMMALPTLIFNTASSFPSAELIFRYLFVDFWKNMWDIRHDIIKTWQKEVPSISETGILSWLSGVICFINPFRIIRMLLLVIIPLGHVVSMSAVSAQGVPGIPDPVNMSFGGINEGLTDVPYLIKAGKAKPENDKNNEQDNANVVEKPSKIKKYSEDDDGHDHGGVLMELLYLPVTIVKGLENTWHWFFASAKKSPSMEVIEKPTIKLENPLVLQQKMSQPLDKQINTLAKTLPATALDETEVDQRLVNYEEEAKRTNTIGDAFIKHQMLVKLSKAIRRPHGEKANFTKQDLAKIINNSDVLDNQARDSLSTHRSSFFTFGETASTTALASAAKVVNFSEDEIGIIEMQQYNHNSHVIFSGA